MKNIWTWIVLIIIIALGIWWYMGNNNQSTDTPTGDEVAQELAYIDVSPAEAKDLIDTKSNLVVLDVSNAYADGHIPGAINHYVGNGDLDDAIHGFNKNVPYLVYCHVDSASISGAQKLIDAGFSEVYRLEGNYAAWVSAGYDVEK